MKADGNSVPELDEETVFAVPVVRNKAQLPRLGPKILVVGDDFMQILHVVTVSAAPFKHYNKGIAALYRKMGYSIADMRKDKRDDEDHGIVLDGSDVDAADLPADGLGSSLLLVNLADDATRIDIISADTESGALLQSDDLLADGTGVLRDAGVFPASPPSVSGSEPAAGD